MPRHDFGDDEYDPTPPPRSSGSPVLILGLVAAGLIVVLVVCGGVALFWTRTADRQAAEQAAVVAEAHVARANAEERKRATVEAEEDRQQADYLARHAALAKAQDDAIPDRYQLLTPAQRSEVDDLRAAIAQRPAVELTQRQRATLAARRDFVKHTDLLSYWLALADQHGGRVLARRLKLSHDPAVLFRLAYGEEPADRRVKVRAAIEKAADRGLTALTEDDVRLLHPYREYLNRLPHKPPKD
jgi:hypothetical protein